MPGSKYAKTVVFLFFAIYLLVGLSIFDNYYVGWDEKAQRAIGKVGYEYAGFFIKEKLGLDSDPGVEAALHDRSDNHYGPAFEILFYAIEKWVGVENSRSIYQLRHLLNFLVFFIGCILFYRLLMMRFSNWKLALLGVAMLIISPRIFADSFYNTKDAICLVMFIISTYTLLKLLDKVTLLRLIGHALACALLIHVRKAGLMIPAITLILLPITLLISVQPFRNKLFKWGMIPLFILLLTGFTIILWPYLWEQPFYRLFGVLTRDSIHFPLGIMTYRGEIMSIAPNPWHYLLTWIGITLPIAYTLLFVTGLGRLLSKFIQRGLAVFSHKLHLLDLLFGILLFAPVILVIFITPVLYDGWRHVYFIYPFIIIFTLIGFQYILSWKAPVLSTTLYRSLCWLVLIISFINTSTFIARNHPFEIVYFNQLAGPVSSETYELDYWGFSYGAALRHVLTVDTSSTLKVYVQNMPGHRNLDMQTTEDQLRLQYTSLEEATYFITNYRMMEPLQVPDPYLPVNTGKYPYVNQVYAVYVDDIKIMGIYKLK